MSVKCQTVIDAMLCLAPNYLAEEWDNIGLLGGAPTKIVSKIVVCLDVTEQVVQHAAAVGADLLISHHPLIFKGLTRIRTDCGQGKILANLLQNDMAVYTAHTNLDIAVGGVNDILAQKLQLSDIVALTASYAEQYSKLVVFVPVSHLETVRQAMAEAGAGYIGRYSHCSFYQEGTGSFLPLLGTNPFLGEVGALEYVQECRLETIAPRTAVAPIIAAMLRAHPYEEVAYDEYPLLNKGEVLGLGRVGFLPQPVMLSEFVEKVKTALAVARVKVAGKAEQEISKVAVCGGSGASLIAAAVSAGAQVLVTGDVKYHEAQAAQASGLAIVDAGHFATEQPVVSSVVSYLRQQAEKACWDLKAENILASEGEEDIFSTQ